MDNLARSFVFDLFRRLQVHILYFNVSPACGGSESRVDKGNNIRWGKVHVERFFRVARCRPIRIGNLCRWRKLKAKIVPEMAIEG